MNNMTLNEFAGELSGRTFTKYYDLAILVFEDTGP